MKHREAVDRSKPAVSLQSATACKSKKSLPGGVSDARTVRVGVDAPTLGDLNLMHKLPLACSRMVDLQEA